METEITTDKKSALKSALSASSAFYLFIFTMCIHIVRNIS